MSEPGSVTFVLLLTLSDDGRNHLDEAIAALDSIEGIIGGLGGTLTNSTFTHGHYDAVVMGDCPDVDSISSLAGWVADNMYFLCHTLIGANAEALGFKGRSFQHS